MKNKAQLDGIDVYKRQLQLRFIVDGMLVLLQLIFQLGQTFIRKRLFQRFFRCTSACPSVPSGEATFGI